MAASMVTRTAALRLGLGARAAGARRYSAAEGSTGGFWSRFRGKKEASDLETVTISGQLELTPSPPHPPEYVAERPPPRSRKYTPPADLEMRLHAQLAEVFGASLPEDWQDISLSDGGQKFQLLSRLSRELQHTIPNSRLHLMRSASDVLEFYRTPVQDSSKFDDLATTELPPNLKIRWSYEGGV
ncbi:large ribosomal subunit protein mL50 [Latimeria chalumnae]|uniref:large ribosomal subunit protein mL50 n=1 Tax=Latimeria chalumnae TaxID=7897 RepID=UPI0006D9002D|nr:PREDICTED: 39S ribosomal protein L50, mitochondrial [Latimeria chalumnae]|eukprot:XP_006012312.2 PREDICTED: 39S ribosomal protein L50, mitochondrial [Latimeria chalumnae]